MTKTDLNEGFERTSFLYGANAQFIEQLYARYLGGPPPSIPNGSNSSPAWRRIAIPP